MSQANAKFYGISVEVAKTMGDSMEWAIRDMDKQPTKAWRYAFEEAFLAHYGYDAAARKAQDCYEEETEGE